MDRKGDDRISELTDYVIEHIFSCLEARDVVRTMVLSKRWRNLWASNPFLNFDQSLGSLNETEFAELVNSVLMTREDCNIQNFCLRFSDTKWVDRWIQSLVRRKIKGLELELLCRHDRFKLSLYLGNATSLVNVKLHLSYSQIQIPSGLCFKILTSLQLSRVSFFSDEILPKLLSGCPLLETLKLEWCIYFIDNVDITAYKLKSLTVNNFHEDHIDIGLILAKLKVLAPNLVSFEFLGRMAKEYDLKGLSSVTYVFIQLNHCVKKEEEAEEQLCYKACKELGYKACQFIGAFPNAQVIKVSDPLLVNMCCMLNSPECFPSSFCCLKDLKLLLGSTQWHLQTIFHLLEYSPNLEALALDILEMFDWQWDGEWQAPEEAPECLLSHLKVVEISNFQGSDPLASKNIPLLIQFLLGHGQLLTKITIYSSKDAQIMQQLQTCHRGSPNVKIAFMPKEGKRNFLQMEPKLTF